MTTSAVSPIAPPAMLGVLGGGQLGRYFVIAARSMGYRVTVLEPDPHSPAGALADVHLAAAYDDHAALQQLADTCVVVTTEFENPPASSLEFLEAHTLVRPSAASIAIVQDRILEKGFLDDIGVNVARWVSIENDDDVNAAHDFGFPAVLKTARLGYDGKGQKRVHAFDALPAAFDELGRVACVLEERLTLDRELSVVIARTADDRVAAYPVAQNHHIHGILDTTYVPAWLPGDGHEQAAQLCYSIARALDYVGVLAVEMFVVGNDVLVNELAPRPHNSGHYTLDAAHTNQFEQQVRAVCGLGLGDTSLSAPAAAMVNLLGDLWADSDPDWSVALADPSAHLHLYGKRDALPGRKMGHLTVTAENALTASSLARRLRKQSRTTTA
ncbi:MAG: 5-(carboxyamino)imidazole ribonucleotide synthase [Actinomycetota bacterium]